MWRRSLFLLWLVGVTSCARSGDVTTLQGCGATFPAPLYKRWFLEFYRAHPNVRTNYLAIGSGAGIRQFSEGLVNFGATDEAQSEKKLKEIRQDIERREGREGIELLQVPLTAGSVALCYNLPGGPELRLNRKTYVGLILGEITHWDDDAISATNPGVALPNMPITFIRRAESSGTTFVFTNHLNAIDPRWKADNKGPGVGKTVQWPVGIGGKGNAGVAALISQTPGALGYLEAGYAELLHLPMAALENRTGQFIRPGAEACRAALAEAKFNDVFAATVPDPAAKEAYPIVSYTWVVCRKKYDNPRVAVHLKELLHFCLTRGQELSEGLGYVPLPDEARKRVLQALEQIAVPPAAD
jgi:phosphate transport system substrate-binding protein